MVFFIFILVSTVIIPLHVHDYLASILSPIHLICLNNIPSSGASEVMSAFACGEKIHSQDMYDFFSRSGLFHLVVASKSHLIVISLMFTILADSLKNNSKKIFVKTLSIFFCFFYFCTCGPQAPITRALFYVLLNFLSGKLRLGWSRPLQIALSTILCLGFCPQWINSLSLLHSSACALSYLFAEKFFKNKATSAIAAYILTAPFLFGWANLHPLGLMLNFFLAPFLFILWFLLSISALFFHPFAEWSSKIILANIDWIKLLLDPVSPQSSQASLKPNTLWLLLTSLFIFLWLYDRLKNSRVLNTQESAKTVSAQTSQ